VRVGGLLMYSVCSVLGSEGMGAVQRAALSHFQVVRTWELAPHLEPFGDGFTGVLLQRT
jgi:16S rRNA C967 or C1407 C5-methylase (RsmB/RsmF family)